MLCRKPCACHGKSTLDLKKWSETWCLNVFDVQIALSLQHGTNFADLSFQKIPTVLWGCQSFSILTSEALPRHSVVQILRTWTPKSAPRLPLFNDFDFQTAFAPQRGANFGDILGGRSSAPARFLGADFPSRRSPQNCGNNTAFRANPTRQNPLISTSHLYHICAITSLCWQILGGNSHYSWKLDS